MDLSRKKVPTQRSIPDFYQFSGGNKLRIKFTGNSLLLNLETGISTLKVAVEKNSSFNPLKLC